VKYLLLGDVRLFLHKEMKLDSLDFVHLVNLREQDWLIHGEEVVDLVEAQELLIQRHLIQM